MCLDSKIWYFGFFREARNLHFGVKYDHFKTLEANFLKKKKKLCGTVFLVGPKTTSLQLQ